MSKPVLLDFSATWCGPCRMQKPIIEKLEETFGDKVDFKEIDVDQNNEMAAKYDIMVVPTLVIEIDSVEVRRFTGVTRADVLSDELNKLL
ncbi:MAG: thioredoxin family protein [Methanosarcinaceae archaeon]|nr:thioredoxin family protein [Methanosarcinaceae archaeon]